MADPSFQDLIRSLSDIRAFPDPQDEVKLIQTHISVVFLAGNRVYKLKKPKKLGFLDFTTVERRRYYCHEEVRLNRRLAPDVYDGVVPIVRTRDGFRFGEEVQDDPTAAPTDAVVDWAVRMIRLPEQQTLRALLRAGRLDEGDFERLAKHIADFHRSAERRPEMSTSGGWTGVVRNDVANFEEMASFKGKTISSSVFNRLNSLTSRELDDHRSLMERRGREGVPADTHGDLRLGHVYLLPIGSPGASAPGRRIGFEEGDVFVIIDCIEFNEAFRWADPVADAAFLFMELEFEDRPELAREFSRHYFRAARDPEGEALLPYYASYRDIVRGKVRSLEATDPDVPSTDRAAASRKATRHFLRALIRLADPSERPGLIVIQGLPGVGKSTLAQTLADSEAFEWVDTDVVRKQLADFPPNGPYTRDAEFERGLYTPDWTEKTYRECLRRTRTLLFNGGRVLVEGSFRRDAHRRQFLNLAIEYGVPVVFFHAEVSAEEAERRLLERTSGVSDANWRIYQELAARWEDVSPEVANQVQRISLEGDQADVLPSIRRILAEAGLTEA